LALPPASPPRAPHRPPAEAPTERAPAGVRPPSVRSVEPVHEGYARVLDWGERKTGSMAKVGLVGDPLDRHPFKGLPVGPKYGQRLRLSLSATEDGGGEAAERSLYAGEAVLHWWSEDPQSGMAVTFRLDDGPDGTRGRHPLHGLRADTILYMASWAVAEDETLVPGPAAARRAERRPFAALGPAQQSQIKCRRDGEFRKWLREAVEPALSAAAREGLPPVAEAGEEARAAAAVRAWCGVATRAQFAEDSALGLSARQRWSDLLRRYEDYVTR